MLIIAAKLLVSTLGGFFNTIPYTAETVTVQRCHSSCDGIDYMNVNINIIFTKRRDVGCVVETGNKNRPKKPSAYPPFLTK